MRHWVGSVALVFLLASSAVAQDAKQHVTGIYSDLYYNKEAGDLLGMELLVVPGPSTTAPDYTVFVQIAEGGAPYTAVVPFIVQGSHIEFTLPTGDPSYSGMHFVGVLTKSAVVLHLEKGNEKGEEESLGRGKSCWQ